MILQGKKTYILAALIVVQSALAFVGGDVTLMEAVNQILMGLGLGTLRLGFKG